MPLDKKSPYQQFLEQLQSKKQTADDLIIRVTKEATGKEMVFKRRVIAGEANEVYEITLVDGSMVFMRISHGNVPNFEQEKWAIEQVGKIGVPVPEILLIKHIKLENKLLSFCVQKKVDGEVLERGKIDFKNYDNNWQRKIINQAGEILSRINSIKTKGFGQINKNGQGKYSSWKVLMLQKTIHEERYFAMAEKIGIDKKIMENVLHVLQDRANNLPDIQPVLNHGDYGIKHFVAIGEKITGILDWGEANGNSPIYELARWDYWYGDEIPTVWLVEGYSNKRALAGWEEEIKWMKLDKGLEVLWWYVEDNYQAAIEKAVKKLVDDLEYCR